MKKIILFLMFGMIFSSISFASQTGDLSSDLSIKKDAIIKGFDSQKDILSKKISDFSTKLNEQENYVILNALGKINFGDINKKILNNYFELKSSVLLDFNKISSDYSLLKEKFSSGLITQDEFNLQKDKILQDINGFSDKYNKLILSFGTDGDKFISDFSGSLVSLASQESGSVQIIKQNKAKVMEALVKYDEFDKLIKKINGLYVLNYDNIYKFIGEVKIKTTENLKNNLVSRKNSYLNKYSNLDFSSQNIDVIISSFVDSYEKDLDAYLQGLFNNFYTQEDYDFVVGTVNQIKQKFFINDKMNYSALAEKDFDSILKKLDAKLVVLNDAINKKLSTLGTALDINDLEKVLVEKIKLFHETQQKEKLSLLDEQLVKQKELISYKVKANAEDYTSLMSTKPDLTKIATYTGQYNAINTYKNSVENLYNNMLDKTLKQKLYKLQWELELQKIDLMIKKDGLAKFDSKYRKIDDKLKEILLGLEKQAKDSGKIDTLNSKIDKALTKIETFLSTGKVVDNSKYMLLKIKKAFLWFKYLK